MDEYNGGITVVGASNWDMFTYVNQMPKLGETIKGTDFRVSFGGKAANQAIQAALLGSKVSIITKLGNDISGTNTLENFKEKNINCKYVTKAVGNVPSGSATIIVDSNGGNNIIIIGGSNDLLCENDIENAKDQIINSSYLIGQLEVSLQTTLKALKIAKSSLCKTILNLTPINNDPMVFEMLGYTDILVINEIELIGLYNQCSFGGNEIKEEEGNSTVEEFTVMSEKILTKFQNIQYIITTLGGNGQLLVCKEDPTSNNCHMKLGKLVDKVVDTSGAGDSFIGSLSHYLQQGNPIKQSIESASKVAGVSVTRHGTQTSYPSISELY